MQQQYSIVPKATMQRYPIYLKALRKLHSQNVNRVLSSELSELVNIAATTIRRDLSFIGCLGKQGYGYDVEKLIQVFNEKLGTGFDEKIILIGVGNLGHALLNYNRWNYVVGEIVMAFEIDEKLIGTVKGIPVYHIDQLEEKIPKNCRIAILTASTDIQNVVDRLYKCGVLGLIDFTHQHISVPKGMILKEIDIVANIQELVFETNTLKKFK
ncbi:MAG: redox-sensing transcriptional repressor Rex [Erysipelotrichaceae bacterium]|nr:redox-sensing transcriptional repressor Rex [Erysipelotrichaceae bacterium]MBQ1304493.1 redox-sensing transcriptional repressor Rex [Erysipelotrichaceae bacterium]MBQ1757252.1 redox-sensing transcriptional repressor Rex [Erysipelotrichaceae bacterium]MBQ2685891.1 redox-sensing transcriptional repressor Rex [Erysipelotrichaceae bacterium]MBR2600113.1 redox-sensing transcriptional repressor Rex [Erysipelotrichaceae bacterium]